MGGGFGVSSVTNIIANSQKAWENIKTNVLKSVFVF
jgi:hypothetical protein